MAGFEFSSSEASGSTTPTPAGGGPGAGVINAALGLTQFVDDGQFKIASNQLPRITDADIVAAEAAAIFGDTEAVRVWEELKSAKRLQDNNPFGPGTPGFDLVSNLFGGIKDESPFKQDFLNLISQAISAQQDIFGKSATQLSQLIASGGNPTDVSALVNQGVEQLKEQFSTSGAGLFSSDVQSGALRLGSELNVGAQEAAQGRLLNALGIGQTFAQTGQTFASRLAGLEQQRIDQFTEPGRARMVNTQIFNPQSSNLFTIGPESRNSESSFGLGIGG